MALPSERDIELYRGDVYVHEFTFQDADGDPLDMSARTFTAQWRTKQDAATAVDFAVDQSQANVGVVVISLTPAQTAALGARGVYDLQTATSGEPETLVRGKVTLTKDVTRP